LSTRAPIREKHPKQLIEEISDGHSSGTIQTKAQFVDVIVNKETIYKSIAASP